MIQRRTLPRKLQKISLIQTSSLDEAFLVCGLRFALASTSRAKRELLAREVLADEIKKANEKLTLINENSFSWKEEASHKELAKAKKVYGEIKEGEKFRKIKIEEYSRFITIDDRIVLFYSGNVCFVFYGGIAGLLLELTTLKSEAPKRLHRTIDSITAKILKDVELKEHSKNSSERIGQTFKR